MECLVEVPVESKSILLHLKGIRHPTRSSIHTHTHLKRKAHSLAKLQFNVMACLDLAR